MNLKNVLLYIILVAIIAPLCACSLPVDAPMVLPTPEKTYPNSTAQLPLVSPTPESNEVTAARTAFLEALQPELVLINCYTMELGYDEASDIIKSIRRYTLKAQLLHDQMQVAATKALNDLTDTVHARDSAASVTINTSFTYPVWQYLAAVLPCIEGDDCEERLIEMLGFEFDFRSNGNHAYVLNIENTPTDILTFSFEYAKLMGDSKPNAYLDTRFTYAYLSAVYDENGDENLEMDYDFTQEYLSLLRFPLSVADSNYRFVNTWGEGRSNNTRMHMGVDIKAPVSTPILSCCDGVVTAVGTANVPGNYVLVMDEYGYEYHYYHMVELSRCVKVGDKVKRGDVVGNVGNTGNSEANHLHLTLVDPNGKFINPYKLLVHLHDEV